MTWNSVSISQGPKLPDDTEPDPPAPGMCGAAQPSWALRALGRRGSVGAEVILDSGTDSGADLPIDGTLVGGSCGCHGGGFPLH